MSFGPYVATFGPHPGGGGDLVWILCGHIRPPLGGWASSPPGPGLLGRTAWPQAGGVMVDWVPPRRDARAPVVSRAPRGDYPQSRGHLKSGPMTAPSGVTPSIAEGPAVGSGRPRPRRGPSLRRGAVFHKGPVSGGRSPPVVGPVAHVGPRSGMSSSSVLFSRLLSPVCGALPLSAEM